MWMQVPAHEQLTYMNVDVVNDVLNAPGIVVQGMQISHDKSPQRWKNVSMRRSRHLLFRSCKKCSNVIGRPVSACS